MPDLPLSGLQLHRTSGSCALNSRANWESHASECCVSLYSIPRSFCNTPNFERIVPIVINVMTINTKINSLGVLPTHENEIGDGVFFCLCCFRISSVDIWLAWSSFFNFLILTPRTNWYRRGIATAMPMRETDRRNERGLLVRRVATRQAPSHTNPMMTNRFLVFNFIL